MKRYRVMLHICEEITAKNKQDAIDTMFEMDWIPEVHLVEEVENDNR